jgi:hypothetical protein
MNFCLGFYARVSNRQEAREAALRHVEVLARPLVLYQNNHPIYWSPSFVDVKVRTLLKRLLLLRIERINWITFFSVRVWHRILIVPSQI